MDIPSLVIGVIATALLQALVRVLLQRMRRRVRVASPEAVAMEKVEPAINVVLESYGPIIDALIAILEALQGECTGNVETALRVMKETKVTYLQFLTNSAKVDLGGEA